MRDAEIYITYLTHYIRLVFVFGLVLFVAVNMLLLILKLTRVFFERRIWVFINIIGFAILLAYLIPPILDIHQSSFCTIDDVVKIEMVITQKRETTLITDSHGEVYTCYDYLVNAPDLEDEEFPGVAIYAKHSKLLLDYFPKG